MRGRPQGYSPAQLDRFIFSMFWEMPSEAFVARMLGLHERDVEQSLERTCSRISALTQAHWQVRLLRQIDELVQLADRLAEVEDPPRVSVAARVRLAALRTSFLAVAGTPTSAPTPAPAPAVAAVAARQPPARRVRRLDSAAARTHTGELAAAE